MSYAKISSTDDLNKLRHVGFEQCIPSCAPGYEVLFSEQMVRYVSSRISELCQGVDPKGRKIVVPDSTIRQMLSSVYEDRLPSSVGDIYSRYIVVDECKRDDIKSIVDRTISVSVDQIKVQLGMEEQNSKLSIWNTVYGDFNENGLRAHPPIKTRERRPDSMLFNMNY